MVSGQAPLSSFTSTKLAILKSEDQRDSMFKGLSLIVSVVLFFGFWKKVPPQQLTSLDCSSSSLPYSSPTQISFASRLLTSWQPKGSPRRHQKPPKTWALELFSCGAKVPFFSNEASFLSYLQIMVLKWINIFAFEFQKAEVKCYLGLQVF